MAEVSYKILGNVVDVDTLFYNVAVICFDGILIAFSSVFSERKLDLTWKMVPKLLSDKDWRHVGPLPGYAEVPDIVSPCTPRTTVPVTEGLSDSIVDILAGITVK